ncbi:MAG: aminotransferase class IV [Bacteroidetes bacterium]|nr:aminotransferase class IV [Bacteroidota bacterium]
MTTFPFVNLNGSLIPAKDNPLSTTFSSGLVETMLNRAGTTILLNEHLNRLLRGMKVLGIQSDQDLNSTYLHRQITELISKNGKDSGDSLKVRLMIDTEANFQIELNELPVGALRWNKQGWIIGVYDKETKKKVEESNFKLLHHPVTYVADQFRKEQEWDEALLLNSDGNIIEGSRTNIFLIRKGIISTPPLSDGCVDGIMRKQVIERFVKLHRNVVERSCSLDDLKNADEVFLTNAIIGIKWVCKFKEIDYLQIEAFKIFKNLNMDD